MPASGEMSRSANPTLTGSAKATEAQKHRSKRIESWDLRFGISISGSFQESDEVRELLPGHRLLKLARHERDVECGYRPDVRALDGFFLAAGHAEGDRGFGFRADEAHERAAVFALHKILDV